MATRKKAKLLLEKYTTTVVPSRPVSAAPPRPVSAAPPRPVSAAASQPVSAAPTQKPDIASSMGQLGLSDLKSLWLDPETVLVGDELGKGAIGSVHTGTLDKRQVQPTEVY